jgi:hypothetical protein
VYGFQGGRGAGAAVGRGGGRGRGGGGGAPDHIVVDNRTRTILVSEVPEGFDASKDAHFARYYRYLLFS